MNADFISDEELGLLEWNELCGWWVGTVAMSSGREFEIHLLARPSVVSDRAITTAARAAIARVRTMEDACRVYACSKVLDYYNAEWSNGRPLDASEFMRRLEPGYIVVHESGYCEVCFGDGELFLGHSVDVRIRPDGSIQSAGVEGCDVAGASSADEAERGAVAPELHSERAGSVRRSATSGSDGFDELLAFLERLPAMRLPAGRASIGHGRFDDGRWWVKFQLDTRHALAWHVVQELGHVLNYVSIEDRLPTVFKPVSPPPVLNGGPDEYLSWVIDCAGQGFSPADCAAWLEDRLPRPVDDVAQWASDDDDDDDAD